MTRRFKSQRIKIKWADGFIPLRWNFWYQLGVGITLTGIGLGWWAHTVFRAGGIDLTSSGMTALSIALIVLGIFLLASTEFGTATILSYRVTRALINGKRGKPVRIVKEWDTYCLQIGVKAAASEFDCTVPEDYANWREWRTRPLPPAARILILFVAVGAILTFRGFSVYWNNVGCVIVGISVLVLAYGRRLRLWTD
jgi:hypothetical protein